jgi:hypothetical protein
MHKRKYVYVRTQNVLGNTVKVSEILRLVSSYYSHKDALEEMRTFFSVALLCRKLNTKHNGGKLFKLLAIR